MATITRRQYVLARAKMRTPTITPQQDSDPATAKGRKKMANDYGYQTWAKYIDRDRRWTK